MHSSVGDRPGLHAVEIRLRTVEQLFHSLDPSPFREKDLDADAAEFIVGWARELPRDAALELVLHLATPLPASHSVEGVAAAVRNYFAYRADARSTQFRELLARGRRSLAIGVVFLATCLGLGHLLAPLTASSPFLRVASESVAIVGWVAMWRPLEIFLYDWWPIVAERRLLRRLARMEVRIRPA